MLFIIGSVSWCAKTFHNSYVTMVRIQERLWKMIAVVEIISGIAENAYNNIKKN